MFDYYVDLLRAFKKLDLLKLLVVVTAIRNMRALLGRPSLRRVPRDELGFAFKQAVEDALVESEMDLQNYRECMVARLRPRPLEKVIAKLDCVIELRRVVDLDGGTNDQDGTSCHANERGAKKVGR
jgi:hypothetical protein